MDLRAKKRQEAEKAGIEREIIEAILAETAPLVSGDDALVYQYAIELNRFKSMSAASLGLAAKSTR